MQLEQRVLAAKADKDQCGLLIDEYMPFISSCASRAFGVRYISKSNDELSIAMAAFSESVSAFDASRGLFLPFAAIVIKRRLIDYSRSQSRLKAEISTSFLSESDDEIATLDIPDDSQQQAEPIKLEIDALNGELSTYHIDFMELIIDSPKAEKTKRTCATAINFILNSPDVRRKMQLHRILPLTEIATHCLIPRKILERHRKYIVAVVEILANDYPYLAEYVSCIRKEQQS
jgi:RNA polymerase sigma factor